MFVALEFELAGRFVPVAYGSAPVPSASAGVCRPSPVPLRLAFVAALVPPVHLQPAVVAVSIAQATFVSAVPVPRP